MNYGLSFIISKVSRQLVHRSSCDSVSRTAAFTHVHTVQLNTLLHMFNGLFSTTTWVSRYQKGKTSPHVNKARDDVVWDGSGISWTIRKQSAPCCKGPPNHEALEKYWPNVNSLHWSDAHLSILGQCNFGNRSNA